MRGLLTIAIAAASRLSNPSHFVHGLHIPSRRPHSTCSTACAVSIDTYLTRFDEVFSYVEYLFRSAASTQARVKNSSHCGFKVMVSQLPQPQEELEQWLSHLSSKYSAKVILLVRQNHLERHISGQMSMATGFSHLDVVCHLMSSVNCVHLSISHQTTHLAGSRKFLWSPRTNERNGDKVASSSSCRLHREC